jgi:hypothetical protein
MALETITSLMAIDIKANLSMTKELVQAPLFTQKKISIMANGKMISKMVRGLTNFLTAMFIRATSKMISRMGMVYLQLNKFPMKKYKETGNKINFKG